MRSWVGIKSIKTERLTLRPIKDSDLNHIFQGLSHSEVIKHYGISFTTLQEAKQQIQWYDDLIKNETGYWWAIELSESNEFIGSVGLNDIKKEHHRGEIGFWLLPEFWGNGYITEAASNVINVGFETFNLHRIQAWVESGNNGSRQVLKKLGFIYEGILKDYEIKNDQYISVEIYSRLVDNSV